MKPNQLPSNVTPEHYDLLIRPDSKFFVSSDLLRQFDGSISIKIQVSEPISELTLNAVGLQLHHAVLDGDESPSVILNELDQTATLIFERTIGAGMVGRASRGRGMIWIPMPTIWQSWSRSWI